MHNDQPSYDGQRVKFTKSKFQKILGGCVITVAVIAVIITSIVLGVMGSSRDDDSSEGRTLQLTHDFSTGQDYCLSETCVHTASRMLSRMVLSVSPCENFTRFVCGKRHSYIRMGAMIEDKQLVVKKLRTLIARKPSHNDTKLERTVNEMYKSCMDTESIEILGLTTIKEILVTLGGWPVLKESNWNSSNFEWTSLIGQLRKLGVESDYIIKCYIDSSWNESHKWIIVLDQPDLTLSRQSFLRGFNDERVEAYKRYQIHVAIKLGADREYAAQQMQKVLEFEMALANISSPVRRLNDITSLNSISSVSNMKEMYHSVAWPEHINRILGSNVKISSNDNIFVKNPIFFQYLELLVANTEKETLANYIIWRAIGSLIQLGTSEVAQINNKYFNSIKDIQMDQRWAKCTYDLIRYIPMVTSAIFSKHYFNIKITKKVGMIVNGTLQGLQHNLNKADWLDHKTKKEISKDLQKITFHIPYTDYSTIFKAFDPMVIDNSSYIMAMLSANKFKMQQISTCLGNTPNPDVCKPPSILTQDFVTYNHVDKALRIPLELLHGVIFYYRQQSYVNFATLGSYVGYVIVREYFDEFEQPHRNKQLIRWRWQKEGVMWKFNCHKTEVDLESLLYIMGVNASYMGHALYWASKRLSNRPLPGFDIMGKREMFWVSAGQMLCPDSSREDQDDHHFSKVHDVFSNVQQLNRDFRCDYEPHKKDCDVW